MCGPLDSSVTPAATSCHSLISRGYRSYTVPGEVKAQQYEGRLAQSLWKPACWNGKTPAHFPVLLPGVDSQAPTSAIPPPTPPLPQPKTEGLVFRETIQLQKIILHLRVPTPKGQLTTQSFCSSKTKTKAKWKTAVRLAYSLSIHYQLLVLCLSVQNQGSLETPRNVQPPAGTTKNKTNKWGKGTKGTNKPGTKQFLLIFRRIEEDIVAIKQAWDTFLF